MSNITEAIVTIGMAIIGVAILSVLVSSKSNTTGVLQAMASGFGNILGVATSPVTGSPVTINTTYPNAAANSMGLNFPMNLMGAGNNMPQGWGY